MEFEATITPGTEVLEHTVGAGGGVIAITRSGHPFEGLELTVPSGAFTGTAAFRFRARSAPEGLVLPAGYVVRGPVLEVQSNAGRSDGLMTLEVPVSTRAGERVVLAFRDPVRGTLEVLPTVAHSATSVTVVTSHLSADLLLGAPAASAAASTAVGGPQRQGTASRFPRCRPWPLRSSPRRFRRSCGRCRSRVSTRRPVRWRPSGSCTRG